MKINLAENLLRFTPKNLDAKTIEKIQKLAEQQTTAPVSGAPEADTLNATLGKEALTGDATATDIPGGVRMIVVSQGGFGTGVVRKPYVIVSGQSIEFRNFNGRDVNALKVIDNGFQKSISSATNTNNQGKTSWLRPAGSDKVDMASAITLIGEIAEALYAGRADSSTIIGAIQVLRYLVTNQSNAVADDASIFKTILQQLTILKQGNAQQYAKVANMNTMLLPIVKQAIDKA